MLFDSLNRTRRSPPLSFLTLTTVLCDYTFYGTSHRYRWLDWGHWMRWSSRLRLSEIWARDTMNNVTWACDFLTPKLSLTLKLALIYILIRNLTHMLKCRMLISHVYGPSPTTIWGWYIMKSRHCWILFFPNRQTDESWKYLNDVGNLIIYCLWLCCRVYILQRYLSSSISVCHGCQWITVPYRIPIIV